ncbi:hypothetical protein J6590_015089 [Homalodisca vitripennis]|nr:hypothetical protein J6590_015089 [Homalodisca vitripennis]
MTEHFPAAARNVWGGPCVLSTDGRKPDPRHQMLSAHEVQSCPLICQGTVTDKPLCQTGGGSGGRRSGTCGTFTLLSSPLFPTISVSGVLRPSLVPNVVLAALWSQYIGYNRSSRVTLGIMTLGLGREKFPALPGLCLYALIPAKSRRMSVQSQDNISFALIAGPEPVGHDCLLSLSCPLPPHSTLLPHRTFVSPPRLYNLIENGPQWPG